MGGGSSVPAAGASTGGGAAHGANALAKPHKTPRSKSTGPHAHALSPSERLLMTYDDQVRAAQKKVRPHSWFNYMYAKYLPNMCRERFRVDSGELKEAELERFEGVVAFVDISGFTKLSEYLVNKHGPDSAAELLNKFISGYFEKLVEVVVLHGGDIIKFAGDAMLVVWRNKRTSLANTIKPSTLPPPTVKGTLTGALTPEMLKANHDRYASDGKARTSISQASGSLSGASAPAAAGAPGSAETPTLAPAAPIGGSAPDVNHLAALALGIGSLAANVLAGGGGSAAAAAAAAAAASTPNGAAAAASSGSLPPTHPHLSVNTSTSSPALTPALVASTPGAVSTPGAPDMSLNAAGKRISSARNGVAGTPGGLTTATPSGVAVGVAPSPAGLAIDGKSPPASPPNGSRALGAPKITIESPSHSHPAAHAAGGAAPPAAGAGAGAADHKQLGLHLSSAGAADPTTPGSRNSVSAHNVLSPTHANSGAQPPASTPGMPKGRSAHSRVASLAALDRGSQESLATLVLRATACNLVLLSKLNNYKAADSDDIRLTLHTGIACGEICGLYVGGVQGMWEFYVAGDPIKDMSDAAEEAQSGEVVISAKAHALIADKCDSMQRPHDTVQVLHLRMTPPIHAAPQPFIALEAERAANAFIPPIVRNRIEAGQTASWLAEFRRVCIMFIALPGIRYDDPRVIQKVQDAVAVVQKEVLALEGNIARLLADDKGTRFKIAFGMPTMNHEDDAVRVVLAGLAIQSRLRTLRTDTSIGIATGHVYCGEAGSPRRCEYTAVGYKVILAARLMQQAGLNGMLCDEDTYSLASHAVTFEERPRIRLKGIAEPVPVFRPHAPHGKSLGKAGKVIGIEANKFDRTGHGKHARPELKSGGASVTAGGGDAKSSSSPIASDAAAKMLAAIGGAKGVGGDDKDGSSTPSNGGREASVMSSVGLGISASAMANLPKGALRRLSQLQLKKSYASQSQSRLIPEARIWGREKEKDKLKHLLKRVTQEGATQICVIEAEGGVGKSAFINDFLYYVAGEQKVDVCYGAGESMEGRTPYFPWKSVFEEMLGLDSIKIVKRKNEKVLPFLAQEFLPLAALLNSFLGTNFEENDVTSNMPADGRAKNMEKLLVEIMRAKRVKSPTANPAQPKGNEDFLPRVIIMEDLHWVDSGTWNLAFDISRTVPNLLVVFTTRPLRNPTPQTYTKITRLKNATLMTLDLLSKEAMLKLACHKLGVHNIPSELFDLIQKKSGGLPLYIEEVIQTMLERKMVRVENGEVLQLNKAMDVLPDNMQGVMVGRIDHLPAQEQLTLKVCAVIGGEVKLDLLKAIHPNVTNAMELSRICNLLCDAGFLVPNNDQKGSYQFKHSYLVETAYNMLALAQRKDVHATIMGYLETTYKHEIAQYYGLLAYHASHAEQWAKALRYKELAGAAAMAVNANPEAADMFESAEEIMNKHALRDPKRLQEIHINLGLVYFAIGRYDGAISRLSQALAALNHPIPDSDRKLGIELLKVLVREYIRPSFVPSVAEKKLAEKKLRQNSSSSVSGKGPAAAAGDGKDKDIGADSPSTNGRALAPLAEGTTLNAQNGKGAEHSHVRPGGPRDSGVVLPGTIDEDSAGPNGALGFPMGRVGMGRGGAAAGGPKLSITGPGRKYAAGAADGKDDDEKSPAPAAGAGAGYHHAAHSSGGGDGTASPPIIGSHGKGRDELKSAGPARKVIGNHASISAQAPGAPPASGGGGGERNSVVSMNGAVISRGPAASKGFTDMKQPGGAPNSKVMFAAGTGGGAGRGGARYSVVRSTTVAPGDRKLLRTQTLYTAAKIAAERRIQLESAVKLLEKLVRACAVRGQAWRAGYCSFHLVEVAEILQNQGLVAMGCCQCAYTCFEFGWLDMGNMYGSRARFIMKTENIADGLRAQINYQDALLHCFAGEWPEAVACLRIAKVIFKRGAEHKKWRECTFAESFCLYFMGKFDESLASLAELIESTLSDGDAYYECNAHYWKCLNMLACDGASEDIESVLTTAAALATEIKLGPSSVLAQTVLRARNQYHQTNSLLIVERLAVEHLHALGTGATLIHLCPSFVNFATLLLDACEHKDLQQPFDPWPKRRKQFMRWAQQAVEALHTVSKMLRYAKASYLLLLGRYRWLEKRFESARDLWHSAVAEAKRSHMPHVQALAEFELGVHPTNTPDCAAHQKEHLDRAYEICKTIHLDVRNDPHLSHALGRRAEVDPHYRKRRDSAQLAAGAAAAAAEIAAGIVSDRKGDSSGDGSPTHAAGAGGTGNSVPAQGQPGGTGFTRPVPLARSQSKALAAALGNSALDDDDGPPAATATPPIASVPLSAVGRHSLALSGRKSLLAAQGKRTSGDKEKTMELLRQASLNSSTLMQAAGAASNGPASGNSSVASSGASTPGSAASAPAAPMQVTVTPPIGGAPGAPGGPSGKPPLAKAAATGVDIMPTIMASPNTSPRSGELIAGTGSGQGKGTGVPASPTNAAPVSSSQSQTNGVNATPTRGSLNAPTAGGTPPAGAPGPSSNSSAPSTGRMAPLAPALNTAGLNGPTNGITTPSAKNGPSAGASGSGSGSTGPINAAAIPTTPKAFVVSSSLSGNRSSSANDNLDSSRSAHGGGLVTNGVERKGSGALAVSQGNSRPASPVSANAHSTLNAPLFRVESVNSHNPLSALPPVTHGGSRKDLLPPLPHLT